jgi:hypothetical protein
MSGNEAFRGGVADEVAEGIADAEVAGEAEMVAPAGARRQPVSTPVPAAIDSTTTRSLFTMVYSV